MKGILTLIFSIFCFYGTSQSSFELQGAMGRIKSPWYFGSHNTNYQHAVGGAYFSFGGRYEATNRIRIKFNNLFGTGYAYDAGGFTNVPQELFFRKGTNSQFTTINAGLEIGYSILKKPVWNLNIFAGAGILIFSRQFALKSEFDLPNGTHVIQIDYANFYPFWDLSFPVTLELKHNLNKRIGLILDSGAFIEPDFPVMGIHLGLGLSYKLW